MQLFRGVTTLPPTPETVAVLAGLGFDDLGLWTAQADQLKEMLLPKLPCLCLAVPSSHQLSQRMAQTTRQ
ncbi:hypothetical protein GGTG_06403 [Gaeumannomyces tritici R3-111a-1]|uniref:Uncharacterized protein n=1 Tax=Gaeumannomyces tritici (strain R3-111a-1) TaxID=644352 RepID=J3NYQ1_GAET3|nr:hypothetical protein GGTG_06403 [Gaeumannomyces tritici R3-111a-1]EJT76484.1 hypothetical protein GGTG_06403 [Gaeumannomyces tritici R3-111a-1]